MTSDTWPFAKYELKGFFLSFWSPFWKSTLLSALVFGAWLAFRMGTGAPDPGGYQAPDSLPGYFLDGLIIYGFALVYCWPLGLLCGALGASWRLFGAWTLFPFLVFPLVIWGFFWLGSAFLYQQGLDIIDALRLAYQAHGMPGTWEALGGARLAHAGGPGAIILLIFLIPPLLMDSLRLLVDPGVLWQLVQFLFFLSLVALVALLTSLLISAVPLLRSLYKRLKVRREKFRSLPAPKGRPD